MAAEGAEVTINGRTAARVNAAVAQLQADLPGSSVTGMSADLGTAGGCEVMIQRRPELDILGGWITVVIACLVIALCFTIRRHYRRVTLELDQLYRELGELPLAAKRGNGPVGEIDPRGPTAAVLVASYGGVGIHTVLNIFRVFPGHFKNLIFVSVGVIDSGEFKGEHAWRIFAVGRRRCRETTCRSLAALACRPPHG